MTRFSQSKFLKETLALLIAHFGADAVRLALEKSAPKSVVKEGLFEADSSKINEQDAHRRPSIQFTLNKIEQQDSVRFELFNTFVERLRLRTILPDAEDIRQFAQSIGLKQIHGKSRRDLLPSLVEFLDTLPTERLQEVVKNAEDISEETRRRGFSVLTDKLMKKP